MRILLYRWKVFNQDDVKSAIEYFGHEVHDYTETVIDKDLSLIHISEPTRPY